MAGSSGDAVAVDTHNMAEDVCFVRHIELLAETRRKLLEEDSFRAGQKWVSSKYKLKGSGLWRNIENMTQPVDQGNNLGNSFWKSRFEDMMNSCCIKTIVRDCSGKL